MPFCCQCGTNVGPADVFCGRCGARQPGHTASRDFLDSFTPRTASMLCYIPVLGWIAAVVLLASDRYRHQREVRFHAFQGLYLFVAWLIVGYAIGPMFTVLAFGSGGWRVAAIALKLGVFAAWIFMIVKTSQSQLYKLPILGELAERSVSEQR